jgi:hypothetical protein
MHAQAEVRAPSGGARVLSRRRRIRRLEVEVAEAWAGQEELRRRLELFEQIAAAAGADLSADQWWRAAVTPGPAPPVLEAAARDAGSRPRAVCLEAAGTDIIAVAGGPGDARDWWAAICCVAARTDADAVTRLLHSALPEGLMAIARRGEDGEFGVVLSEALAPGRQRDAVRTVIRAARGQHRVPALVPVPVAASVSAARSLASRAGEWMRAHARLATATAAAAVTLIAVIALLMPGLHPARNTAGGTAAPGSRTAPRASGQPTAGAPPSETAPGSRAGARPGTSAPSQPGTRVVAARNPSGSGRPSPAPQPAPSASSSAPAPAQSAAPQPSSTPAPTPTSSSGSTGVCVLVLGVRVCL